MIKHFYGNSFEILNENLQDIKSWFLERDIEYSLSPELNIRTGIFFYVRFKNKTDAMEFKLRFCNL